MDRRAAVRLVGAACVVLGCIVLAGWHADSVALVRLRPDLPAMQAVTALGLLAGGLGLLVGWRVPVARAACAGVALVLGVTTVAGFLFQFPAFLHTLMGVGAIDGGAVRPRHMAPNTALALCFLGIGLLLAGRRRTAGSVVVAIMAGAGAAGLAAQDVVRYAGEAAGLWTSVDGQMAVHGAFAFLALGGALMLDAGRMMPVEENVRMRRAVAAGVLALAATFLAAHLIRSHQSASVNTTTRTVGDMLAHELEAGSATWQRQATAHGRLLAGQLDARLATALAGVAPGYVLEVTRHGRRPYHRGEGGPPASVQFVQRVPLDLADGPAMLSLWPSRALLQTQRRPLALAVLVMGSALALLLALSVQALETARTHARRLEAGVAALADEVRERRRAQAALADTEQRLNQSRKMEAVARLAGGVAHEFNNLLSVIAGYAQLVGGPSDEAERRAWAAEIDRAAQRGARLTRRLLTMSARHVHHPEVLDLGVFVRAVGARLTAVLDPRTALSIETEDGADTRVSVDREQLEEAIRTLATNAADAMNGGGRMQLAVRRRTVEAEFAAALGLTPGAYVELMVTDDGRGMRPEELRAIFEPFGGTPRGQPGGGLGLAMLYGFVRQSGGAVDVTSAPGAGTRFRLFLPSAAPAATQARIAPPAPRPAGSGTVLVAEDEDALRRLVTRVLERAGYTVIEARNGAEALSRARRMHSGIDLLVTDVVMPEIGGRDLALALRARLPELPVLFISGYTDAEIAGGVAGVPGARFLQKPFPMAGLLAQVAELLPAGEAREEPVTPCAVPSSA